MTSRAVLIAVLLVAAGLAPTAGADHQRCPAQPEKATRTLRWEYTLGIDPAEEGRVHVELRVKNMRCLVTEFQFTAVAAGGKAVDFAPIPGLDTPLERWEGGFSFEVDSDEEGFAYEVGVREPAFRLGEHLAYVGPEFALFKAEAVQLTFRYNYFEGIPFRNETTVRFDLPDGWRAATPWNASAGGVFRLAPDSVQPRGYVVAAPGLEEEARQAGGKTFRYVRLGEPGGYEEVMWDYFDKATPYYEAVYGSGVGRGLLIVNAPDPMFRGGLGGVDSIFLHEQVDLRTLAHEYAHVHQLFTTVESPPDSSLWLHEGDADYQSALSLTAAGYWTPSDVDLFLQEARRTKDDPYFADARLPDAGYGGALERFAYRKGSVVLRALDDTLRAGTDGEAGVADVMRRLNAEVKPGEDARVDNAMVRRAAEAVSGLDLSDFFERYVHGTQWPDLAPYVPEGQFLLGPIRFEPPDAQPGDGVTASVEVTNPGTRQVSRTLDFRLAGETLARRQVTLPVGASTRLDFGFVAPGGGPHEVAVGYQRATFRSPTPAEIVVVRASTAPATLRAGADATLLAFLENRGERAGTARIELVDGSGVLAHTTETILDGREARTVPLAFRLDAPGERELTLRLLTPGGTEEMKLDVTVEEADADLDGIPDARDPFPTNPRRAEAGAVGDAVRDVAAPAWLLVLAVLLAALARRR